MEQWQKKIFPGAQIYGFALQSSGTSPCTAYLVSVKCLNMQQRIGTRWPWDHHHLFVFHRTARTNQEIICSRKKKTILPIFL
jgi:hypothetical protein